nr:bifunctional (p)ppGpp synthetase/guanosine-3',5'-bis(diphosphate) 3'-pyrophosphohydrolase [Candidatus Saccharibacteria bacterium]
VLGLAHVFEVQIRTHKMHDYAEHGLAAHFQYDDTKPLGIGNTRQKPLSYKKISWVQNLLDWQENLQNTDDIKEGLALDLFKQRIFVFSPKGDLYDLPEGATPVDFAFCLHTQLGLTCRGAKVNNRIVPLDYHLQNRDIVEIFSFSESPKPSRDWLSFVVTAKARSHIKAWYRQFDQTSEERKGQQLLDEYLTLHKKIRWQQISKGQQTDIVRRLGLGSQGELFKALFEAKLEPSDIMREIVFGRPRVRRRIVERLIPSSRKARPAALIPGIDREHISRAGCCSPRYPQAIVGFVSRSGHFRIHQSDCSQLASDRERCVPAYWYFDSSERLRIHGSREYTATILKSLSAYLHGFDAKAHHIDEMSKGDEVQFDVHLSLVRSDKLLPLITALRRLPGVESVEHLVGS